MKPETSSLLIKKSGELKLSGTALCEFMRTVLEKGNFFRFRARGLSMHPFIKDGDMVTISPFLNLLPRLGDIIAFVHPESGKLGIHRLVGKQNGYYLEKGDNVPNSVGMINENHILGIVKRIERNGERIFLGMGPEKYAISLLSRSGFRFDWLIVLVNFFRSITKKYRS